ncbi:MAG: TIM barrel protein [Planctomycetales bacterium]|nr:TIM barrel protein [Planctomycetales bacterium]NIM09843.1 TIM barrel protein [Planctomycetales bacterium]NIN09687.1 TIM barrel protein [Planctomycetales bacterium]NIN78802.1 TIM barrel protein [Planctomycetales bacterium]NIO35978.1 TIM barrel protein [Planctomycetales bacterium]
MTPALAQVCSLSSPFSDDIADYAAGHCHAIEIWLGKLETFLHTHSTDDVRRLLDKHQVAAATASYQGGVLTSQGQRREQSWAHFRQRLALARQLKIRTLVLACDTLGPVDQQALDRASGSLSEAARLAEEHQVRLALEFQARAAFGNNLQTAVAMVAAADSAWLGICLDAFHFYCGPSKLADLQLLTPQNLFHVQVCDLAGHLRELATDADRILPGDGDLPLSPIVDRLRQIDYDGFVSVELMNPQIWQVPARQFGEIAMTAVRKLLGQASMD